MSSSRPFNCHLSLLTYHSLIGAVSSVVERLVYTHLQEHFRASAFSLRESLKMRLSEGKHRSKRAIPHASHVITKSNDQYHTRVTMTFERERAPLHAHARAMRDVSALSTQVAKVREAALGLSCVPPEAYERWRGRIISKSGISLAGRRIKRYIGARCDALWRAFSCAKHACEVRSNSQ
jgi:hypothetical protein